MSSLTTGTMLEGRYRIANRIASGGMSTVYAAIDTRLDREVAVKVMEPSFASDEAFRKRFEREARAVARLNHPNLVNVFDQGVDSATSSVFLVMELIDGGSLRELLKQFGPMPPHAAMSAMRSVLTALSVAHDDGMIHRDLKPDNVLISTKHEVKLADFGLVRALSSSGQTSRETEVIGTVAYLSPEQVRGLPLTQASDVYSAGIMLFELLTGRPPFRAEAPADTALARLSQDVPAPSQLMPNIPPEIDRLVTVACHREPERRYPDGRAFLDAVERTVRVLRISDFEIPVPPRSAVRDAIEDSDFGTRMSWHDISTRVVDLSDADPTVVYGDPRSSADTPQVPQSPQREELTPAQPDETLVQPAIPADPVGHRHPAPMPDPLPGSTPATTPASAPGTHPPRTHHGGRPTVPAHGKLTNRHLLGRLLWAFVLVLAVLAVALGSWWMTSGRYGEIPVVLGMDEATAQATVQEAGFSSEVQERYSDEVARDEAIGTDPPFGERALQGSRVSVLMSLGRPVVPEIGVADSRETYESKLAERRLTSVLGDEVYSDTVAKGLVAETTPGTGTEVPTGSSVTIHLSKGPEPREVKVPMVIGKSPNDARRILEAAGFKVEINGRPTVGQGIVIVQSPGPLSRSTTGETVKLTII